MKSAAIWPPVQEIHDFTADDLARPATRELLKQVRASRAAATSRAVANSMGRRGGDEATCLLLHL